MSKNSAPSAELLDSGRGGAGNTCTCINNTAHVGKFHQNRIKKYFVRQWNIQTNPVHSSAHRVATTDYGAGGYLKER